MPFQPPDNLENQNFKIEKNTWRYYNFTDLHHKWQSYDVSFLTYGVQQTEFVVILDHFLPFYPPMDPENQNFEKMKKTLEDIIILQMCTINDSHMMYGSWDMECNRENLEFFCHFRLFIALLPPPPLITQKINENTAWRYYHFTQVYHKWHMTIIWCMVPEIQSATDNQNFEKLKKIPGDIIIYTCVP